MAKDLLIGSHVGLNAPEYYLGSVKEAISYGATTFMFYTGAPQNSYRKPLNELMIKEGRELLAKHSFDESKIVVHAPYIINAANPNRPDLLELSIKTIINELQRTAAFGAKILVLHPGCTRCSSRARRPDRSRGGIPSASARRDRRSSSATRS